jgi:hypothetical protein
MAENRCGQYTYDLRVLYRRGGVQGCVGSTIEGKAPDGKPARVGEGEMSEDQNRDLEVPGEQASEQERQQAAEAMRRRMGLHLQQTVTIHMEWWIVAAAFHLIYQQPEPHPTSPIADSATLNDQLQRYTFNVYLQDFDTPLGTMVLRPKDGSTQVQTMSEAEQYIPYWQALVQLLSSFAATALELRRKEIGARPDELIETYYRSRAAGGKITLKQLAAQAGISYSYITKAKMAYDRAGKWGSRVKELVKLK